jgi:hypothetical protein
MDDNKVTFQRPLERVREVHCRHSRTTVEKQQDRPGAMLASNEDPLLDTPDLVLLERSDALGRIYARRTTP